MQSLVYINGALVPEAEAKISVFDLGFVHSAVFIEALRTFRHQPFRLEEHLARLENSMRLVDLEPLASRDEMREAVAQVLAANLLRFAPDDDCWISLQVTPGEGAPHPQVAKAPSTPTIICYATPLPHSVYAHAYKTGKAARVSIVPNLPQAIIDPRAKTRFRLHYLRAKNEVAAREPGAFAVLLDENGFVTEGVGANLFMVRDGVLYTPGRNILEGISRGFVIELAREMGIAVKECDLRPQDFMDADEAFWTTTSYCILSLSTFEGQSLRESIPGPLTGRLTAAWSERVGIDIVAQARRFA